VSKDWFYSVGDSRLGPVTEDELKRLVAEGKLKPSDLVWRDGMADWVEARTVEALFPKTEQPRRAAEDDRDRSVRRRLDSAFDDERPSRRGSRHDEDDDRPSRRRREEVDDEDDRPRVRRDYQDERGDDYEERPRRRKVQKPGQVQAVGVMMLVGGIIGTLVGLGLMGYFGIVGIASMGIGCLCCLWPGIYLELVWGILAIIRGINIMNQDDQGPPRTLAILQIICIINGDIPNCVMGIVCLVMMNGEEAQDYYRRKGFY
jgi:hypothetical protein